MRDPVDIAVAMVAPILQLGGRHAENLAVYQRQLMFGAPGEKYRSEGLALLAGLEAAVAAGLAMEASERALRRARARLRLARARNDAGGSA